MRIDFAAGQDPIIAAPRNVGGAQSKAAMSAAPPKPLRNEHPLNAAAQSIHGRSR